jgi:uncharacterized protein (DUF58 family)
MNRLLAGFARVYAASQWLRRRFTPTGLGVLALCVAAGVLGVDTQRSMAFQLFALCAALLLVASIARFFTPRPSLALRRELPRYATAGVPFNYRLELRNTGKRPLAPARVRDALQEHFPSPARFRRSADEAGVEVNWVDRRIGYPRWLELVRHLRGGDLEEASLGRLERGASARLELSLTPLRRGPLRFAVTRLLRPEPLGLLNAVDAFVTPGEVLVLPRRYPVPPFALPGARRLQRGGVNLAAAVGESEEFVQLRDYRPGDALRHIHWRSFARLGHPVVKEYEDEFFTRHALALDTFGPRAGGPVFEAAVSVAASLVAAFDQQDALLDLMFVEDRTYVFTAGRAMGDTAELLRVLAAVEAAQQESFERLARHVLSQSNRLTGCILVLLDLDEPRRAFLARLRGTARVLALLVSSERPDATAGVHWIDPRDVGASLRALKASW